MTSYKTITCQQCGSKKDIPLGEYNRKIKKQTPFFCSRSCCGSFNIKSREDLREYNHSEKNKLHMSQIKRTPANPFNYFLNSCRQRKQRVSTLTEEYLKSIWENQKGLCAISGIPLELPYGTKGFNSKKPFNGASVDRIDSSIDYVEGNIQFVCMGLNFMKSDWSGDYFHSWLLQVSKSVLDKYKDVV